MNKKLRLLVTKTCNRKCEGCCNKQFDLDAVPKINAANAAKYELVMLTGGEPMLYTTILTYLIKYIKAVHNKPKVYVYTAKCDDLQEFLKVLRIADGITLTLHERDDVAPFLKLADTLTSYPNLVEGKSMRLHIFKEVGLKYDNPMWKIKPDMEWIEYCPVPADEDFRVLD